ncbi:MAG: hypothetical protein U5K81_14095 [Trueperaceae bacterium]|nr:hypothetical protein [Trueperaceae bacterium]
MIAAMRTSETWTDRAIEIIRVVMLLLVLIGWVMYPVELFLLDHWTEAWRSRIPFLVSIPGLLLTLYVLFDRTTPIVRFLFVLTMWVSIVTGLVGSYYHIIWNFAGDIEWTFEETMKAVAGWRPTMAAMAYTHMGVTGLLAIWRAR